MAVKRKRGYSREFPGSPTDTNFFLNRIPIALWTKVRRKASREGVSMRTLLLRLLTAWLDQEADPSRAGHGP